jgi:glutathione synthase
MTSIAVVADPLNRLDPAHDSTVALMEEAGRRGYQLLVTTAERLGVSDGRTTARCVPVEVVPAELTSGRWVASADWWRPVGRPETVALNESAAVLMRTDPPFDGDYLRVTYLLDHAGTLVLNAPHGLREANEKLFALRFPSLIPETVVSADPAELAELTYEWGAAVLKPTDAMAARGVLLLQPGDPNLHSLLQTATAHGRRHVVVQRRVDPLGEDRRLVVVAGEPVGAIRRVAAADDFRGNLAAGAQARPDAVTAEDRDICRTLAPELDRLGVLLAGVDLIAGRLIEVNVTSPTGLREVEALTGERPASAVLDLIDRRG